jgi:hypothetical protein
VELKPYYVASEFLADVGEKYGYDFRGSLVGDKSVSVVFDNSKLKRLAPKMTTNIPFHKGVRMSLDYVLSHEDRYEEDPEFDSFCDVVIDAMEKAKAAVIERSK